MKRDQIKKEFSAGGIVFRKEKNKIEYLLIKDGENHWTIPKGHIETEEDPKTTALREISEETGLSKLEIVRELGDTRYFYCQGKNLVMKTVYLYLISSEGNEEIKPDKNEVRGAMWFSGKEALKKVTYKNIIEMLNKAIKGGHK